MSILSAIPVLGDVVSAGLNYHFQQKLNHQQQENAAKILNTQREWALSDWDKVNAYNAPAQQMARYKEAGLNPHLIYGSATNSPSAMVRSSASPMPVLGSSGFASAASAIGHAASGAMNTYFAQKSLENDTLLKQAQVLNLKAQSDKTTLQNKLTQSTFDDLVEKIKAESSRSAWDAMKSASQAQLFPSPEQYNERYNAETEQKKASAKHMVELIQLAKKEGKLKQSDIDTLETLSTSPTGVKIGIDLLRMILKR